MDAIFKQKQRLNLSERKATEISLGPMLNSMPGMF